MISTGDPRVNSCARTHTCKNPYLCWVGVGVQVPQVCGSVAPVAHNGLYSL